jgi:hypothetical protein
MRALKKLETISPARNESSLLPFALFSLALGLSAFLLFIIEPMVAKQLLPTLGGAPAVWNTTVLFFQFVLLLGYGYADFVVSLRAQRILHSLLLLIAIPFIFSFSVNRLAPGPEENPIFWVLKVLTLRLGLPCFLLSTSSPLLQKWFNDLRPDLGHRAYSLYTASNVGSLFALLAYPLIVEPLASIPGQIVFWKIGGAIWIVATFVCLSWRGRGTTLVATEERRPPLPNAKQQIRWVALAFFPTSWMLGLTTYVTTDIAAIPLSWVIPLALYLTSYLIAFTPSFSRAVDLGIHLFPTLVVSLLFVILSNFQLPLPALLLLHGITFFAAAVTAHGVLARSKPEVSYLTRFYFCVALGGVLGGFFNAILAPLCFSSLEEYLLVIPLFGFFLPSLDVKRKSVWKPLGLALLSGLVTWVLLQPSLSASLLASWPVTEQRRLQAIAAFGVPLVFVFTQKGKSLSFGAGLVAICLAGWIVDAANPPLFKARSFFGVHRVDVDPPTDTHRLFHGTTTHGLQRVSGPDQCEPLGYYHRRGPAGEIFGPSHGALAVIGLGAGSLAPYVQVGQTLTFYEIDPVIEKIARNPRLFTYLSACVPPGVSPTVILGDGRLKISEARPAAYQLIVIDAFSSDAIPIHLITHEAIALYLSKLERHGLLAFHISNRFVDLRETLGNLANSLGVAGLVKEDPEGEGGLKFQSTWAILTRDKKDLETFTSASGWLPLPINPDHRPWDDSYSNVVGALRWD